MVVGNQASEPILGLRLKTSSVRRKSTTTPTAPDDKELTIDQLQMLHYQDVHSYKCNDYLERRRRRRRQEDQEDKKEEEDMNVEEDNKMILVDDDAPMNTSDNIGDDNIDDDMLLVDAVCREKMCEWSYRVCDHFHAPRDVVAISFALLDRFLDRCQCDRTSFKLAAMTTLYMADKLFGIHGNHHRMSIRTLAHLSRGEFEMSHMAEMERLILKTCGWKVNAPTVQAFIDGILSVLPIATGSNIINNNATSKQQASHHNQDLIYQRAIFFAELAIYDYTLVSKDRALIALASICNAMEGMNYCLSENQEWIVIQQIQTIFGFHYPQDVLESCRNRLWYIYGNSAQYQEEERRIMMMKEKKQQESSSSSSSCNNENAHGNMSSSSSTNNDKTSSDDPSASANNKRRLRLAAAPRSPVSVTAAGDE